MAEALTAGRTFRRTAVLLPLLLTALAYLATSPRAVIDYDEAHYAQPALQMYRGGDWVTPYDNGVRFLEKPPLTYWVTAASFHVFGVSEFALRFPTAVAVVLLTWIVILIARTAWDETAGMVAGLCTSFSVGAFLFTREALHDIWLVFFLTLAMYAFASWRLDPQRSRRHAWLFSAAIAGAFMTKSLIGVAFPVGMAIMFFLLGREWPDWRRLHIVSGSALFLVLVVPWHVLAAIRNPGFLQSFFLNEQVLRFFGKHDPPILWSVPLITFWALLPVWFFPWTAFLPAAVRKAGRPSNERQRVVLRVIWAWLIVVLGFYSVSARLEHYAFPLLPALAVLTASALAGKGPDAAIRWGFRGLSAVGGLLAVAGLAAAFWYFAGHDSADAARARTAVIQETDFSIISEMPAAMQRDLRKPAMVTILVIAVAFAAALAFDARGRRLPAIWCIAAGMIAVCGMIQWSLIICEDLISSKKIALVVAREARAGDRVVVLGDFESANSICFYQPLLVEVSDGVAYSLIPGMKYPDAPRVVLDKSEFLAAWKAAARIFALVPRDRVQELKPAGIEVTSVLDRVLVRNH